METASYREEEISTILQTSLTIDSVHNG